MNYNANETQLLPEASSLFLSEIKEPLKTIVPLGKGTTNYLFLVNEKYVLRLKNHLDTNFYQPLNEQRIYLLASEASLAPHLYYFDKQNGNMISHYEKDGTFFLSPSINESLLCILASSLKKFHELPKEGLESFLLFQRYQFYKGQFEASNGEEKEKQVISLARKCFMNDPLVTSHNDLVKGNVLLKEKAQITFIDFEYAGLNYPLFDIASIFSENGINDINKQIFFLKQYFGNKYRKESIYKLHLMIGVQNYLWYYWALRFYQDSKKEVYLSIAKDKLQAIQNFVI
jgi:thiamine kinase-like enzyme